MKHFPGLLHLFLNDNELNGTLPTELATVSDLCTFVHNRCLMSGTAEFPLTLLADRLRIRSNAISGSLPIGLAELHNFWALDLANNELTGSVPPEYLLLPSLCKTALIVDFYHSPYALLTLVQRFCGSSQIF